MGGALEVVAAAGVLLQVAVEQVLAQLHGVAAVVALVIADGGVLAVAAGAVVIGHAAQVDDSAVRGGDAAGGAVGLHHGGLQGVQGDLGHLVAGHGRIAGGVDAVKQLNLGGLLDGGHPPVGAEILGKLEVAQGLHHHQSGLHSGDGVVGAVLGGADAAGDAVGIAGGHIGVGPLRHVGEGDAGAYKVLYLQVQQVGHDHGHLGAGHVLVGVEVAVLIADHHGDGLHDTNGFLVVLGSHVGIARSAGADRHHANQHHGGDSQTESPLQVSHRIFLLLDFWARSDWTGRHKGPASGIPRVGQFSSFQALFRVFRPFFEVW